MSTRFRGARGELLGGSPTTTTSTGTTFIPDGGVHLYLTTAAVIQNLAAPYQQRGQHASKRFVSQTTSSALKQVIVNSTVEGGSTSVTIGASATTLTFTAIGQFVELIATSATRWEIAANVGSTDSS